MREAIEAVQRGAWRLLGRADALLNRLYGWRYNPLYMSGTIVVLLLAILLASGLYLLLFYRIGAPYESVAGITDQAWLGRWIRGIHRFASDAAVVAAAVHAFRVFAQDRHWGQRALAWVSGLVLLFIIFVSGWTGYVMVWDVQAQVLAVEGARLLDALPIFSEPISRAFTGAEELPGAFFFLNLFLHVAIPLAAILFLWLHVSRVARAKLLPPKGLAWGIGLLLLGLAVLWPVGMDGRADLLRVPGEFDLDVFFGFWLPLTRSVPAETVWIVGGLAAVAVATLPWWGRPREERRPEPSWVDQEHCTGCRQCYLDCPYEAIEMVADPGGGEGIVAEVDPALCVSCGICAGSCAPMRVGPPGRTGRDQLAEVRAFLDRHEPGPLDIVVVACERGAGGLAGEAPVAEGSGPLPGPGGPVGGNGGRPAGGDRSGPPSGESPRASRDLPGRILVYPASCAGSVHSSVLEFLLRDAAGGIVVAACPPRDCWNREGAVWLRERMYEDREAELQERVDRSRVRLVHAGPAERGAVMQAAEGLAGELRLRAAGEATGDFDLIRMCEEPEASGAGEVTP